MAIQVLAMTGHLLSIAVNGTLLVWDPNGKGTIITKFEHPDSFRCMVVRERDNQVGGCNKLIQVVTLSLKARPVSTLEAVKVKNRPWACKK